MSHEPTNLPRPSVWVLTIIAAFAVVLALIAIDVALVNGSTSAQAKAAPAAIVHVSGAPKPQAVDYLSVTPGINPGPDGKLHDAFSQTTFYVKAGQPVKLVINNTDTVPHAIMSAAANIDIVVKPGTHTYTLLVKKAGTYQWMCNQPCDPYSMAHMGYMMGNIIAS